MSHSPVALLVVQDYYSTITSVKFDLIDLPRPICAGDTKIFVVSNSEVHPRESLYPMIDPNKVTGIDHNKLTTQLGIFFDSTFGKIPENNFRWRIMPNQQICSQCHRQKDLCKINEGDCSPCQHFYFCSSYNVSSKINFYLNH